MGLSPVGNYAGGKFRCQQLFYFFITNLPATMSNSISDHGSQQAKWPGTVLRIAAIYNLVWGAWVIFFPNHLFDWTGIPRPNYPGIWQCVGMIVGVYGIGYWFAARDFVTHWPIVLVGFLGKIFGPIGFVQSAVTGVLPWSWGVTILTNDLVWWVPFGAMLYIAFKTHSDPRYRATRMTSSDALQVPATGSVPVGSVPAGAALEPTFEQANRAAIGSDQKSLWDAIQNEKILLIFVRHAGCTFCRENLTELKTHLSQITSKGVRPMVVHMSSPADGQAMMASVGLPEIVHVSDPNSNLYRAYGLERGKLSQLFGPSVWWRGFQAAILKRNGLGTLDGDGFQLGGTFLLQNGKISEAYPAKNAADPVPFQCVLN